MTQGYNVRMRTKKEKTGIILIAFFIAFAMIPAAGIFDVQADSGKAEKVSLTVEITGQGPAVLNWKRLSKSEMKKITGFAVFRNGKTVKRLGKKKLSFKDFGLEAGQEYTYQVKTYKKTRTKQWYNKKTGKWQKNKPAKKYRSRSRIVTRYSYKKTSNTVTVMIPKTPEPYGPTGENNFELQIGEPVVIAKKEGTQSSLSWGVFQFPKLYFTGDDLVCKIANKPDSVLTYDGEYLYYESSDNGSSWRAVSQNEDRPDCSLRMDNGRYFQGANLQNAHAYRLSGIYDPQYRSDDGSVALYYAEGIPEYVFPKKFKCTEYDPVSKKITVFTSEFEWPYMPVREIGGLTYTAATCMYHFNMHSDGMIVKEADGSLLMAVYSEGFNTDTGTVEYGKHYNIYLFRSTDCARTWKYVSQILTEPEYCPESREGFCEPNMIITAGGDYFIIMRTGSNAPSYCAYSADKGATWDNITEFSSVGVDPQLLQLDCGVTLASYGRPGIYLRATDDKDCRNWKEEGVILEPSRDSCCYSSLIQTGKDTALIAYSVFDYPKGKTADAMVKSIIVREIKVVYQDNEDSASAQNDSQSANGGIESLNDSEKPNGSNKSE